MDITTTFDVAVGIDFGLVLMACVITLALGGLTRHGLLGVSLESEDTPRITAYLMLGITAGGISTGAGVLVSLLSVTLGTLVLPFAVLASVAAVKDSPEVASEFLRKSIADFKQQFRTHGRVIAASVQGRNDTPSKKPKKTE